MALMTPNPNGSGDGLDEDLTEGDIILLDENGNKLHFQALDWEEQDEPEETEKDGKQEEKVTK